MGTNKLEPVTEEDTTERKVPFFKRLGRSFRHTFTSFRTGTGPQQHTTNDKFMEGQLGEFVQSYKETTPPDTWLVGAVGGRESEDHQDWERLGAKPKALKVIATAPPPYPGPQEDLLQEQTGTTRDFNRHLDQAGLLLNYNRDSEEERLALIRKAATLLFNPDPSFPTQNGTRVSFYSQYWHTSIVDIPGDEFVAELQHQLEANHRNPLTDEEAHTALESLLILHPHLNTPAKVFEYLNLRTGYTPIQLRSYENSEGSQASPGQPPTPPHRTVEENSPFTHQEKLVDVPTPDFANHTQTSPGLLKLDAQHLLDRTIHKNSRIQLTHPNRKHKE